MVKMVQGNLELNSDIRLRFESFGGKQWMILNQLQNEHELSGRNSKGILEVVGILGCL
jgi:hypothetical protein